jgi:hypothetical protein
MSSADFPELMPPPESPVMAPPPSSVARPSSSSGWLTYLLPLVAALIGGYLAWSKGKVMAIGVALASAVVVWLLVKYFLKW